VFPFPFCIGFVFPFLYFGSDFPVVTTRICKAMFLNRRAAAWYRALASIIPGREKPEETTICYEISLVQLIANFNVILYLSICHTVYISALIGFMIMPWLIINTYVSLMYELKKIGNVFTSKFVGTGPSSYNKRIYRATVSQRLRNTDVMYIMSTAVSLLRCHVQCTSSKGSFVVRRLNVVSQH
jgi:hypothetical protein